ncbi:MAG: zinc ribbon domain-containing protein [Omnitrophica bacterium]|nr:zinc ribbon domain-containing protein [Candidatus Omnitrophota bacterium]
MPTYEYECRDCKEHFEIFQGIKSLPLESCPKCKGRVTRLIGGGSGIIFKGSGFYATDYKKGKKEEPSSCPLKEGKSEGCASCPAKNDK